ncbi:hypothetical protein [Cohnella lupini]|uniref:MmyB-like transcription regulator ligand binding domain-containing protein n=1 Tax=Cohnella lupini TaxID=1294267 RepID=A0A3D9INT4_9BACL|nr:hypothetical protein [Cohnella lupini]RED63298.1 hypothetical protein DFP95_104293 [Cohnella lupini]
MNGNRSPQYSFLNATMEEIEALRTKRQRLYADQTHPSLKRFTQQELNDEACPTYKNLLIGRSHRLPDRQTLLRIADYLECTLEERNDLLVAAGYLPIHSEMTRQSLENDLKQAQQMMSQLSLPAMIVTPTLDIHEFNDSFRHLFDVSHETFNKRGMNLFDFHFNSDFPIRYRSTFNEASFRQWETHAIQGLQAFKRNHLLSRHEDWYQRLIQKLHQYEDAAKYWNVERNQPEPQDNHARTILARTASTGEWVPIRYKQTFLSVGRTMHTRIGVFLPDDEPARKIFEDFSCLTH